MTATLEAITRPVERELKEVRSLVSASVSSSGQAIGDITRQGIADGGKQIRPALALLSGAAAGKLSEAHIHLSAATELIHLATLVHDDIIDGAAVRRGQATVTASWGAPVAVLLGDYLLSQAFAVLCGRTADGVPLAMVRMTRDMCEGEILHLRRLYDISMTEGEYEELISRKTAALFAASCRMSAALSGAPCHVQDAAEKFAREFGIAYQIIDDCLDVSPGKGEKDRLKDLEGGKVTLPLIKALSSLGARDREYLAVAFRSGDALKCRAEIAASGAIEESMLVAARHLEDARKSLDRLRPSIYLESLISMTHYLESSRVKR